MTVKDIFNFLNDRFPVEDARDFDNVGILVGAPENKVNKALISLDCNMSTVKEAIKKKCNLIITHHPVIFSPIKSILSGSVQYELIANNISVISMHTNLDVNGLNDCLCSVIGLKDIAPVMCPDGYLLKSGNVSSTNAKALAKTLKKSLGGCIKYIDGNNDINKVLVCSGSGGDYIEEAIKNGYDALVTADVKHHHFLLAEDNGISLFDAGHYNTEDIIIEPLYELLSAEFNDIKFITYHPETIKYV